MNNEELTLHAGDDYEEKEERDKYDDIAQDPEFIRE